jgi:hypothetical protein
MGSNGVAKETMAIPIIFLNLTGTPVSCCVSLDRLALGERLNYCKEVLITWERPLSYSVQANSVKQHCLH